MLDDVLCVLYVDSLFVDVDVVIDEGFGFLVDLKFVEGIFVGYCVKLYIGVIDFENIGYYDF